MVIDPELQRLAHRRQNQRMVLAFLITFVLLLLVLGWTLWQSPTHGDASPAGHGTSPRFLLFAAFPLVIIALEFGVFLWLRRRGLRWLQPSPFLALDRGERRRLLRAIRKGELLTGRDGELARDVAQRLARQRWLIVVLTAALVLEVVIVSMRGLDALGVLVLVGAVLAAVALPFALRDVRRGRVYLELDSASHPRHDT